MEDLSYEQQAHDAGYALVCGVDEAGAGPLMGPVYAAASILAKVSRDHYVIDVLDKQYPEYQFARHKGYGTKLHYEMLDKFGPCAEHRMSFLKKWSVGGRT